MTSNHPKKTEKKSIFWNQYFSESKKVGEIGK
jgi:hypothetical protein